MRVSERYRFDARGPATHGAAHAAVPSRLLCIYSNYVTSRIHCLPHHPAAETAEDRRAKPSTPETVRMARSVYQSAETSSHLSSRLVPRCSASRILATVARCFSLAIVRVCEYRALRGIALRSDFRVYPRSPGGCASPSTTTMSKRATFGGHARRSSPENVQRANRAAPNDETSFKSMEAECGVVRRPSRNVSSE